MFKIEICDDDRNDFLDREVNARIAAAALDRIDDKNSVEYTYNERALNSCLPSRRFVRYFANIDNAYIIKNDFEMRLFLNLSDVLEEVGLTGVKSSKTKTISFVINANAPDIFVRILMTHGEEEENVVTFNSVSCDLFKDKAKERYIYEDKGQKVLNDLKDLFLYGNAESLMYFHCLVDTKDYKKAFKSIIDLENKRLTSAFVTIQYFDDNNDVINNTVIDSYIDRPPLNIDQTPLVLGYNRIIRLYQGYKLKDIEMKNRFSFKSFYAIKHWFKMLYLKIKVFNKKLRFSNDELSFKDTFDLDMSKVMKITLESDNKDKKDHHVELRCLEKEFYYSGNYDPNVTGKLFELYKQARINSINNKNEEAHLIHPLNMYSYNVTIQVSNKENIKSVESLIYNSIGILEV